MAKKSGRPKRYKTDAWHISHTKGRPRHNGPESTRDTSSPQYQEWRKTCLERDGYLCQMCRKKTFKCYLEVHHIKKWSKNLSLRFDATNGITLCKKCHRSLWGKEEQYEEYFFRILLMKTLARIRKDKADAQDR
jgi:5-methylcytosine-specific restriction endonuclease McrA